MRLFAVSKKLVFRAIHVLNAYLRQTSIPLLHKVFILEGLDNFMKLFEMFVYFVITQGGCTFWVAWGKDVAISYRLRLIIPIVVRAVIVRVELTEWLSLNFLTVVIPLIC